MQLQCRVGTFYRRPMMTKPVLRAPRVRCCERRDGEMDMGKRLRKSEKARKRKQRQTAVLGCFFFFALLGTCRH